MSSEEAALVRLLARSSRAELRGLRREGVLAEGVAGVDDSLSMSDLNSARQEEIASLPAESRTQLAWAVT